MKTLFAILLSLLTLSMASVKAAVIVSDITKSQFDSLISTYQASFSVIFRGGGDSGFGSEEIQVAINTATPQLGGGGSTSIANLPGPSPRWSQPITDIQVTLDLSANINVRAASSGLYGSNGIPTTRAVNQVLILTADSQLFGNTSELTSNVFEGVNIRDLFADGSPSSYDFDVVSVTGMGDSFNYTANWAPSSATSGDTQYVWIVALNNTSIPEPTSTLLLCFSTLFLWRRNRK